MGSRSDTFWTSPRRNRKDSGNRRRDRSGLYPVSQILGRHLQGRGCYGSRKQGLRRPLRPHPSVKSGGNGSSCAEWGLKLVKSRKILYNNTIVTIKDRV